MRNIVSRARTFYPNSLNVFLSLAGGLTDATYGAFLFTCVLDIGIQRMPTEDVFYKEN